MHLRFASIVMLTLMTASVTTSLAIAADEPAEVVRLQRAGQSDAALLRAEKYLASNPRDPQMRFLKAVILGDSPRRPEAIAILEKLTEDYPDLAEPYNNLAVLHAASGNYLKARAELEQALRLSPGYAVAYENLGDVQAALARDSYAEALRLEPGRVGVPAKIVLLKQLLPIRSVSPSPGATASSPAAH